MKKKSYAFLLVLVIILTFVLGVRYGQRVEQTNKAISYLISITPTTPITPTIPIEYEKYTSKSCGIEFAYPSTLIIKSEATGSALLVEQGAQIEINCNKTNKLITVLNDDTVATASLIFKNRPLKAKTTNSNGIYVFSFVNPQNGKTIYAAIEKHLYPLFESSLQFAY